MPIATLRLACQVAVSDGIPRRSLGVALVVGTILNLINQGDALFGAASVNWTKALLTYCVPYAVATYGAISYRLSQTRRGRPSSNEQEPAPMREAILAESVITCPSCGAAKLEPMPQNACQWSYECTACGKTLRPRPGDCCVFCSYGSVPCPPIQAQRLNGG